MMIRSILFFIVLLGFFHNDVSAQLLNPPSNSSAEKSTSAHEELQSTIDSGFEWYSMEAAQKLAAEQQKKVLIFGYAEWCTYCLKMRKESLPDSAVVDAINRYFIPVQLNGESEEQVVFNGTSYSKNQLARGLQLQSFPTHYFVGSDGGVLGAQPGFIEPDIYSLLLKYVGSNAYERISFDEYVDLNM